MATMAESAQAYGDAILERLDALEEAIKRSGERDEPPVASIVQRTGRAVADGAGLATVELGGPAAGSQWEVESITFNSGAPAAVLRLYLDEVDGGNMIVQVTANATTSSGALAGVTLTIPENRKIFALSVNGTAGAPVVVRIQARQVATEATIRAQKIGQLA